jgi:hypothetical protein
VSVSERTRLGLGGRRRWLLVVLLFVFLAAGVPRFLADDDAPDPDATFTKVCRDHGGTPSAPASQPGAQAQRICTVRYGGRVYRMDAITPTGFDEDTAAFQRQGCEEAQRQQGAAKGRGNAQLSFVYHPDTGVCERRP